MYSKIAKEDLSGDSHLTLSLLRTVGPTAAYLPVGQVSRPSQSTVSLTLSHKQTHTHTLKLSVAPMPETNLTVIPPDPVEETPLQIDCSSAVPPGLQGEVTVTLLGPNRTVLAENTGTNSAETVFSIPRTSVSDTGNYTCRVTVRSSLLTSRGNPRPIQDTSIIAVTVSRKPPSEMSHTHSLNYPNSY